MVFNQALLVPPRKFVGYPLLPGSVANRLLTYVDMTDSTKMTFMYGALFSNSQVLIAPYNAKFDLSASGKVSVEFWRNPTYGATNGAGTDQCWFCFDELASGKKGISIGSGGGAPSKNFVYVRVWDGSVYQTITTGQVFPNWSHCVVTIDTSSQTLIVYLDGIVAVTVTGAGATITGLGSPTTTGAIPTSLAANTSSIRWGSQYYSGALHNQITGSLACGRIWINRVLSSTEAATLFGKGLPTLYASLGSLQTSCVGAWDMTEDGGNRADSTTTPQNAVPTATTPRASLCVSIRDQGPLALCYRPRSFLYAPLFAASPVAGINALQFCGTHALQAYCELSPGVIGSCDMIAAVRPTAKSTSDSVSRCMIGMESQDALDTVVNYTNLQYKGEASDGLHMRLRSGAAPNSNPRTTTSWSINTNYLNVGRWLGRQSPTLDTASWAMRINRAAVAIDQTYANWSSDSAGWNNTQNTMSRITQLNLGSENYNGAPSFTANSGVASDFNQDGFQGWMFSAAIYTSTAAGGALSAGELTAVENALGTPIGV